MLMFDEQSNFDEYQGDHYVFRLTLRIFDVSFGFFFFLSFSFLAVLSGLRNFDGMNVSVKTNLLELDRNLDENERI